MTSLFFCMMTVKSDILVENDHYLSSQLHGNLATKQNKYELKEGCKIKIKFMMFRNLPIAAIEHLPFIYCILSWHSYIGHIHMRKCKVLN